MRSTASATRSGSSSSGGPSGRAGGHGAEAAGARADVAEDHEGCGAMFPALALIGAARAFADGVQIERAHDALEILIIFAAEDILRAARLGADGRLAAGRRSRSRELGKVRPLARVNVHSTWFVGGLQLGWSFARYRAYTGRSARTTGCAEMNWIFWEFLTGLKVGSWRCR